MTPKPSLRLIGVLALVLCAASACRPGSPAPTAPALDPLETQTLNFPEGSGIIYDPSRQVFFIISDEGRLLETRHDLSLVRDVALEASNFEGITRHPATGLLYAVIEGRDRIVEIDPAQAAILREFSVNRKFEKNRVLFGGKEGFEGIAFVPNSSHPQGGTFFVTNQVSDPNSQKESSAVVEIELPLVTPGANANKPLQGNIVTLYPITYTDLSDIFYDAATDEFLVVADTANQLLKINRQGAILMSIPIAGTNQEGVTLDAQRNVVIIEDLPTTTQVYRYTLEP